MLDHYHPTDKWLRLDDGSRGRPIAAADCRRLPCSPAPPSVCLGRIRRICCGESKRYSLQEFGFAAAS